MVAPVPPFVIGTVPVRISTPSIVTTPALERANVVSDECPNSIAVNWGESSVPNSKALQLVGENWGKDTLKKIGPSTYGCINILLDYDQKIRLPKSDLEYAMETEFNLQRDRSYNKWRKKYSIMVSLDSLITCREKILIHLLFKPLEFLTEKVRRHREVMRVLFDI